jgi:hypothetical protein
MVSELIRESLKISLNKTILLFLNNGFRFEGKILGVDTEFIQIYDIKKSSIKFIRLNDISECELK